MQPEQLVRDNRPDWNNRWHWDNWAMEDTGPAGPTGATGGAVDESEVQVRLEQLGILELQEVQG